MLSHFALMMNPNLDEKGLKECLEKSFESKHRQIDSIGDTLDELKKWDKELDEQEALWEAEDRKWNEDHPEFYISPRCSTKHEREMQRASFAMQMTLMVLLY